MDGSNEELKKQVEKLEHAFRTVNQYLLDILDESLPLDESMRLFHEYDAMLPELLEGTKLYDELVIPDEED